MKRIFQLLTMVLFVVAHTQTLPPSGVSSTENYIYTRSYLQAVTSSNTSAKQVQGITYFDGLGRPKQSIGIKATPQGKDIVTPIVYDGFGRQTREYLPLPQSITTNGAIYPQNAGLVPYPVTDPTNIYGREKIYSEKNLENSPLDRVLAQRQVGNDWNNKPINFSYDANGTNEVKKYTTTTTWSNNATVSTISEAGFYPPAQMYKNTVTDEDGNISIEFKNGQGKTLLVRKVLSTTQNADTYYVYNEFDQLAFVISPLASASTLTSNLLDNLCYQYRYDTQNRLVEKKLPGKGWEYMVYDKQDRLVATQDANMRLSNQWLFTKYDMFGRVAFTGMFTGGTRSIEQAAANNALANNVERKTTIAFTLNGQGVYYGNPTAGSSYPSNITTLLSVNYYDTYPADMAIALPSTIQGQSTLSATIVNNRSVKSMPTASYVKNIEDNNWTRNYTFYDTKARAIGSYSQNHLGGYTRTETILDFAGVPQNTFTYHKRVSSDTEKQIKERFVYDSQNRLLQHYHQVNTNAEELLANNTYNELSQLNSKKVGGNISTPLQTVDYKYNIRGWMTQINDLTNLGTDVFAYGIKYQNPSNATFASARYNGNIAEIDWRTSTDNTLRRYGCQYDRLNRLTGAVYQKPTAATPVTNAYNENLSYDVNGNILSLNRFGGLDGIQANLIDQLAYTYTGNQLTKVTDTSSKMDGYPSLATHNNISYDPNGNMINHLDKNISSIQYNFLNLPRTITQSTGSTAYVYRADGLKVKKTYGTKVTDYLDGFQYENNSLQFLPTAEGYYDFANSRYVYNYTDHLGNVRVSYFRNSVTGSAQVLEENNYYPFGLKHTGYNGLTGNPSYQYKYNGKELQETGMYDFGARMYMADIGRWGVVDPLAEQYRIWSPFNYGMNNPIRFIDPDGRGTEDWVKDNKTGNLKWVEKAKDQATSPKGTTYVGESTKEGDLTYAADGKVYDDSPEGKGQVTSPEKNIEEVVLKAKSGIIETPWMDTAFSQIGVTEFSGAKNNPIIIGYHSTTILSATTDSTPWCASFVNYCLTQNNIPSLNSASAFAYLHFGEKLDKPAYGALAIMKYSHVGFVAGQNSDGRIILLGGNQGDAVNLSPNGISQVKGYRYPSGYTPNYNLPQYNIKSRSLTRSSSR